MIRTAIKQASFKISTACAATLLLLLLVHPMVLLVITGVLCVAMAGLYGMYLSLARAAFLLTAGLLHPEQSFVTKLRWVIYSMLEAPVMLAIFALSTLCLIIPFYILPTLPYGALSALATTYLAPVLLAMITAVCLYHFFTTWFKENPYLVVSAKPTRPKRALQLLRECYVRLIDLAPAILFAAVYFKLVPMQLLAAVTFGLFLLAELVFSQYCSQSLFIYLDNTAIGKCIMTPLRSITRPNFVLWMLRRLLLNPKSTIDNYAISLLAFLQPFHFMRVTDIARLLPIMRQLERSTSQADLTDMKLVKLYYLYRDVVSMTSDSQSLFSSCDLSCYAMCPAQQFEDYLNLVSAWRSQFENPDSIAIQAMMYCLSNNGSAETAIKLLALVESNQALLDYRCWIASQQVTLVTAVLLKHPPMVLIESLKRRGLSLTQNEANLLGWYFVPTPIARLFSLTQPTQLCPLFDLNRIASDSTTAILNRLGQPSQDTPKHDLQSCCAAFIAKINASPLPNKVNIVSQLNQFLGLESGEQQAQAKQIADLLRKLVVEQASNRQLRDSAYQALLAVVELYPLNADESIDKPRQIAISTGHQFDVIALFSFHVTRHIRDCDERGRRVINPSTNVPMSEFDERYVLATAREIGLNLAAAPGI